MKYLIATATSPDSESGFNAICENIRGAAGEADISVVGGILWTPGPGCHNVAFELQGDESACERFVGQITMALMPSKWSTTGDNIPEIDTWNQ